jgi:hypothetical protein
MESADFAVKLVILYPTSRRHIPENSNSHVHDCKTPKPHMKLKKDENKSTNRIIVEQILFGKTFLYRDTQNL